ncbi:MAG: CocE/NonD family hydrolase [Actinobacteria bacterium]|nr:MAG: CocE/NonD family hydrolase [Actinomycetota bacterium]
MEHRRAWIPLADGTRLAARLWLPATLPAPALLEALPYRMDDLTASYSSEYERLCREGGLAVARVDLRGTGSSGGVAVDEYAPLEQADLAEVIEWLSSQRWCTGRVGMYGTSYSGFNSIQMAVERPAALHAICAIYATDDRYTDDVHYTGGALRALDPTCPRRRRFPGPISTSFRSSCAGFGAGSATRTTGSRAIRRSGSSSGARPGPSPTSPRSAGAGASSPVGPSSARAARCSPPNLARTCASSRFEAISARARGSRAPAGSPGASLRISARTTPGRSATSGRRSSRKSRSWAIRSSS